MAKRAKRRRRTARREPEVKPSFLAGVTVAYRSLVVDQKGNCWWIDPDGQVIKRAEPKS